MIKSDNDIEFDEYVLYEIIKNHWKKSGVYSIMSDMVNLKGKDSFNIKEVTLITSYSPTNHFYRVIYEFGITSKDNLSVAFTTEDYDDLSYLSRKRIRNDKINNIIKGN